MIQASELRLGNWIKRDNKKLWRGNDGTYVRVGIDELVHIENDGSFYSGIELTERLLMKCGFGLDEWGGYGYWYPNEDAMWAVRMEGNGRWQFCMIVRVDEVWKFEPIIEHLHQLQNLFYSLAGKELNIEP